MTLEILGLRHLELDRIQAQRIVRRYATQSARNGCAWSVLVIDHADLGTSLLLPGQGNDLQESSRYYPLSLQGLKSGICGKIDCVRLHTMSIY